MTEVIDLGATKNSLREFDKDALWEKHSYIDMQAGEVTMLVPVNVNRTRDTERTPRFFSAVTAARGGQPVQIAFEIEGVVTLEEALAKWLEVANAKAQEFHDKAEEAALRRTLTQPAGSRFTQMN